MRRAKARMLALQAAATYCNGGGWGGAENVIAQAKIFETYLLSNQKRIAYEQRKTVV
jgi:hypothetical protein